MERKKEPKHDIERKTGIFRNLGLTLSLLLVILAFEWPASPEHGTIDFTVKDNFDEFPIIPPTAIPPPPPPPKPIVPTVVNEVIEEPLPVDEHVTIEVPVDLFETTLVEPPVEVAEETLVLIPEVQPEFPGGLSGLYEYLANNIVYPSHAQRIGIEGRVFVEFIVDKDGSVTEVKVVKGVGAGCDEEALRVMEALPNFTPGKQGGRPVKVKMVIPIYFRLN